MGLAFRARAVVLTVGTFLGGRIHVGESSYAGGRAGDPPANRLAARLREMPFRVGRLKTGTPPRLDGRSIDFAQLAAQGGDVPAPVFSFLGSAAEHPRQVDCHLTATNERTHDIIRSALDRSPMYSGAIAGTGPRYCPSVEDKVVRFADKPSHQIFIEPEGLDTREVYPNGISTSLPFDAQLAMVRSIRGFAGAHITRPGYAIEYDYFDPRDLSPALETRHLECLYFAGQINGTTGYEEAAAQGLLAGVNAARRAAGLEAWWPRRDEAYLGVLVDDLTTRGTAEPYRMFTSRAEYRLLLREDNADLRLTPAGRELGLVDDARWRVFSTKREAIERETARLETVLLPAETGSSRRQSALELLRRPGEDYDTLIARPGVGTRSPCAGLEPEVERQIDRQVAIQARYAGYLKRQQAEIARLNRQEGTTLPADLDYARVSGLSTEARQKLGELRPATVGQASRIPGITPAAVSLLLVHLKRRGGERRSA